MITAGFVGAPEAALVLSGDTEPPAGAVLTGARARTVGVVELADGTWTLTVPLAASRWNGPVLPLPTGDYALAVDGGPSAEQLADLRVEPTLLETVRATLDGTVVRVDPPVDPVYDSAEGQDALERRYASRAGELENAVFFESFYGRTVGCNPLAIDRELARTAPAVTRYWSVVDLSVAVPEGAIPVVEGTPAWWRARARARLLVVNDWLRRRFVRHPGQIVLQTWHGTPLKRLALHRPGFDPRRMLAVLRESRRWNVLLAQNPYAARILSKAYAFLTRPVWVEGYPRNDALVTGDPAEARAALGLGPDERVILYAPTWRDDRDHMVDFIDPQALAEATGSVVLVRGHSRTLLPGRDAEGARVVDVTGFGDTTTLLLAADALVTDYSSVMFDYTVTGKPIVFLVPDLEHFRGELRGFYFDLAERAPGPLVRTQAELVEALAEAPAPEYAERYATWRATFNARDDGRAAERVVARILDQGFVSR
ncbi:CDP-glycerol glycerophosphotransferase family protein [Microbacterium sp. GXF7504]